MGRETKKMFNEHMAPKFEHFRGAEMMHNDGNIILFPQCKPMMLSTPTNKYAACKITNKRGAAEVKKIATVAMHRVVTYTILILQTVSDVLNCMI